MNSCRIYVYGVHYDGTEEFLVTELDKRSAKSYCEKHAKVFRHRFSHYILGMPSQDKEDWEVVE